MFVAARPHWVWGNHCLPFICSVHFLTSGLLQHAIVSHQIMCRNMPFEYINEMESAYFIVLTDKSDIHCYLDTVLMWRAPNHFGRTMLPSDSFFISGHSMCVLCLAWLAQEWHERPVVSIARVSWAAVNFPGHFICAQGKFFYNFLSTYISNMYVCMHVCM
jgi:hypothetical protein